MNNFENNNTITTNPIAIIGGNSLSVLPNFVIERRRVERTPYGEASAPILFGKIGNTSVAFLARHGLGSNLEQEDVNDLANIHALSTTKASLIIGVSSAISISENISEGDLIIPNQLIDIGNTKISRFPKPINVPYRPLQFADPYDEFWRVKICTAANNTQNGNKVHIGGTYILTSGLRSETRAEAHFYRQIGGTALGATGAQEAALARDINIPYVSILVIVRKSMDLDDTLKPSAHLLSAALQISKIISSL